MTHDLHTYTVQLDGLYYALGADLFMEHVYSLESSDVAPVLRTGDCRGRNDAIRSICRGYTCSADAVRLAARSGIYVGQLYSGAHSANRAD